MKIYRTLGRSGLRVSPLCLGGMTFGEEIKSLDKLSTPPLSFVTSYKEAGRMFRHIGIKVNGFKPPVLALTQNIGPGKI